MDIKELKKLAEIMVKNCEEKDGDDCSKISCYHCHAEAVLKAGYILPASSSLKLVEISENDVIRWAQENSFSRADVLKPSFYTGIINKRAQLSSCEKAHASILAEKAREIKELVDALELAELWLKERLADDHVDLEKIRSVIAKYGG